MQDFTLRAPDHDTLFSALRAAGLTAVDPDDGIERVLPGSHAHALDMIGDVVKTPAVLDEDGNVVTPAEMSGFYHANLRLLDDEAALSEALAPWLIAPPAVPKRIWA